MLTYTVKSLYKNEYVYTRHVCQGAFVWIPVTQYDVTVTESEEYNSLNQHINEKSYFALSTVLC